MISAIVVTYNSTATIAACLRSLLAESRRLPLEVLVVDNGSSDGTLEQVAREAPAARRLAAGGNRGFAAGCNLGAAAASGEWLFFLNPDAVLRPLCLVELARALGREPQAGIAGPRILAPDGTVEPSFGPRVSLAGEGLQRLRRWLGGGGLPGARRLLRWRSLRPATPFWVSGAALLVRAEVYRELGGMDEGFFLYFEDVDLCARARALGHDVIYWPRAEVVHERGVSARSDPARVGRAYRESQVRYYRKHRGVAEQRLLRLYLEVKLRRQGAAAEVLRELGSLGGGDSL